MSWKRYKHFYIFLFLVALASFGSIYHYMMYLPEQELPQPTVVQPMQRIIGSDTTVFLCEQFEICEKYSLGCSHEKKLEGAARQELNDLTYLQLLDKFPQSAGWSIGWQERKVTISRKMPGLCPEHSKRWHLGRGKSGVTVAVYSGPAVVGEEGGLIQETELRIENLPPELQERINADSLEFVNWDDLISTLDSLDEYRER